MRIIKPVEFDPSEGSFARASTGTYFDKDGVLRTAAVDEPRWNYTFEDGEWVGPELLREGEGANLLTYSEQFDNAAWTKGNASILPNQVVSPDGTLSADKLVENSATSNHSVRNGAGVSTGAGKVTLTVFAKAAERAHLSLELYEGASIAKVLFDLSLGSASGAGASISSVGAGWYRCTLSASALTGSGVLAFIYLANSGVTLYTGDGTSGLYIWGAQLEVGDHPTSYIRTLDTPATRAADLPGRIVTNVPEDDAPVWTAGTYDRADRVIQNHRVYEVLAETTTDSPEEGVGKEVPSWLDLGATNRWRMFDDKVGSLTEQAGSIAVELQPGAVINSVALFNLLGRSATVTLTDPSEGVVYQRTVSLVDAGVSDWYEWFFSPIGRQTDFVLLDLPAYGTATLSVTIDNASDTAAVGHLVMGRQAELGVAVYGSSVGITDYSRKETDVFGNSIVVERSFSKRAEFDVVLDTPQIGRVQRMLASLRAQPVVWIGAEGYESTFLFGYYRDFQIPISGPSVSDATITVEGLT